MSTLREDTARMSELVVEAARQTGILTALADGGQLSPEKLQKELELASSQLERSAIEMRKLCEKHAPGIGGYGQRAAAPQVEAT